jgi:hypothetical protein
MHLMHQTRHLQLTRCGSGDPWAATRQQQHLPHQLPPSAAHLLLPLLLLKLAVRLLLRLLLQQPQCLLCCLCCPVRADLPGSC